MKKQLRLFMTMLLMAAFSTMWAEEETITFSELGYSNQQTIDEVTGTNFSVSFNKGTNQNAPKYYTTGTAIRVYGGGYFIVSSTKDISKIVVTFGSGDGSNPISTDVETYENGTWTGMSKSVKFTIGGTTGNRRIAAITVTFKSNESTTLYIKTGNDAWHPYVYTWDDNGELTGNWNNKQQATDLVTISGIVWHKKTVPSSSFSLVLSDGQGDSGQKTNDIGPLEADTYIVYNSETNDGITNYQYSIVQIAEISAEDINVKLGQTENSIINVNPTEAQVEYISGDETIATIDSEGVITGIGVGETTITVKTQKPAVNGTGYVSSGKTFTVTVSKDKVSTPYISVPTGTYNSPQSVSIYCNNPREATIYYTTDETDPLTSETRIKYTESFTVEKTTTIKAYAEYDNMDNSDVSESIITLKTATPTFTPVEGTYSSEQNVTITCATEGATIYYTIDGTQPTTSSSTYSGSITVSETTTIKALAVYGEMENSDVVSATYNIKEIDDGVFIKATSVDVLEDGMEIIIVNESYRRALGNKNNNNFGEVTITIEDDKAIINNNNAPTILSLEKDADIWYLNSRYGYLYNKSTSSNYLRAQDSKDEYTKAKISINDQGNASIVFQGINSRNTIMYNSTNSIFSCYTAGSNQKVIQIYYRPVNELVAKPTIQPAGGAITENTDITISCKEGLSIYYTTDGTSPVKDGALTGTAKSYSVPFNMAKAGTVKAVAMNSDGVFSKIVSATYTFNGTVSLPYYERFDAGLGNFITIGPDNLKWEFRSHQLTPEFIAKYGDEERKYAYCSKKQDENTKTGLARFISPVLDLTEEGLSTVKLNFIHAGAYFTDANLTSTCRLQIITDEGKTISDESVLSNADNWIDLTIPEWFDYSGNTFPRKNSGDIDLNLSDFIGHKVRICFLYDASRADHYGTWNIDQISVRGELIEEVNIPTPPGVTVEKGYTTYVTKNDIDAATTYSEKGVALYKVVEFDANKVVLVQLGMGTGTQGDNTYSETLVPANSPVLVKGDFGENDLVLTNSHEVIPKLRGNLLRSAMEGVTATANDRFFVLQHPKSVGAYGFHMLGVGKTLEGRKAYLNGVDEVEELTITTNAKRGIFFFGEETDVEIVPDNIEATAHSQLATDHSIYDLQGRKVDGNSKLPKGIYITNGKKFVVK